MSQFALLISDTHIGSWYAPWPPEYTPISLKTGDPEVDPRTGSPLTLTSPINTSLKYHDLWQDLKKFLARRKIAFVINNGDAADGPQFRSKGKMTVTADLRYQCLCARDYYLDLPIDKDVPWYFTLGSEYHSVDDRPLEQYIADLMTLEGRDVTYRDDMVIHECGINIHAAHYTGVTRVFHYRSTPLARDMMSLAIHDGPNEYGPIDMIVESHAHYFWSNRSEHTVGVITPCWQARTPYGVKKGYKNPPSNGWVIAEIKKKAFGGDKHIEVVPYTKLVESPVSHVGRDLVMPKGRGI